jgi:hypothetical protein
MNLIRCWIERRRIDRELADTMADHLKEKIQSLIDDGVPEEQARLHAQEPLAEID